MSQDVLASGPVARIAPYPIHPLIAPFAVACFVGALFTDIAYWRTAEMMWADFSAWLVTVGVILAYLAAIAGAIDFFSHRLTRRDVAGWPYIVGNVVLLILATLNAFVHTHDAWTSVVPWGLTLSALIVLVVIVTAWIGWSVISRRDVGVVR
jgi:uncharacterized membrane protein